MRQAWTLFVFLQSSFATRVDRMIESSGYTKLRVKMVLTTLGFSLIPLLILGFTIYRHFQFFRWW